MVLHSYMILFDSIWEKSDIYDAFYEFCKLEFNQDSLDALVDIRKFLKLSEREEITQFIKLYKIYFQEEASKEVNIGSKMKETLKELNEESLKYKNLCCFKEVDHELVKKLCDEIKNVYSVVSEEISFDSFPRFIRTTSCKNLMKKYLHHDKIMIPAISLQYPIQDSAFEDPIIYKSDLNFMKELLKETYDWDLAYGCKNYNIYYSKDNFLPKSKLFKGSYAMKFDIVHKGDFEKVCYSFFQSKCKKKFFDENKFDVNDNYKSIDELKKEFPDNQIDYPVVINDVYLKPHGIINGRLTRTVETIINDESDGSIYYLHKPYYGDFKYSDKLDLTKPMKMKINGKEELSYFCPSYHLIKIKQIGDGVIKLSEVKSM